MLASAYFYVILIIILKILPAIYIALLYGGEYESYRILSTYAQTFYYDYIF